MKTMADKVSEWTDLIVDWMDWATVLIVKALCPVLLGVVLGYAWRMAQGF